MDAITLENVAFAYERGKPCIHEITAGFQKGRLSVLIGPNGSGKTTLLKLALGLLKPKGGHVRFFGSPLKDYTVNALARRMAYVPQKAEAAFDMRVLSYVLMGRIPHLGPLAPETKTDVKLAQLALARVNLEGFDNRYLNTLSGGEMQRAAIAKALCQTGECLLLDEPAASLDIAHAIGVMTLLRDLCEDSGATALCVMHDITLAAHFADDLYVMKEGRIAMMGDGASVMNCERLNHVYQTPLTVVRHEGAQRLQPLLPPVSHRGVPWLVVS